MDIFHKYSTVYMYFTASMDIYACVTNKVDE